MSKRKPTKKKPRGPAESPVDAEEQECLQTVCHILTEAVAGALKDAGVHVDYALVVRKDGKNGNRMSAVGSNMEHGNAAQTFQDLSKGFRKAAGH